MSKSSRYFIAGSIFIIFGFLLWWGILFLDSGIFFVSVSRRPHQHPSSIINGVLLPFFFVLSFFVSALVVGSRKRFKVSYWIYPFAYGVFLVPYLICVQSVFSSSEGLATLLGPIPASALGGYLAFLWRKVDTKKTARD